MGAGDQYLKSKFSVVCSTGQAPEAEWPFPEDKQRYCEKCDLSPSWCECKKGTPDGAA